MGNTLTTDNKIYIDRYIIKLDHWYIREIPNDEKISYVPDTCFSHVIDCDTGLNLKVTHQLVNEILYNTNFYFHGTSLCKSISILLNGVQNVYFKKNKARIQSIIGDEMFYLTDAFQKTLFYGDCILVFEMNFKTIAQISPSSDTFELEEKYEKIKNVEGLDVLHVMGVFDRFGGDYNNKNFSSALNYFSEYAVKNITILKLKYIIRLSTVLPTGKLYLPYEKYIINMKDSCSMQHLDTNLIKEIETTYAEGLYIPCSFSEYCFYAKLNNIGVWKEERNGFQTSLNSGNLPGLIIGIDFSSLDYNGFEILLFVYLRHDGSLISKSDVEESDEFVPIKYRDNKDLKNSLYQIQSGLTYDIDILYVFCQYIN